MAKKVVAKKKVVKIDAVGQAHIHSSFNNIIISLTNNDGQVISWSSAGKMDSVALRRTPLTLLRWRPRIALRSLMTSVCARSRSSSRVQVTAVSLLSAPSMALVSKSLRSST